MDTAVKKAIISDKNTLYTCKDKGIFMTVIGKISQIAFNKSFAALGKESINRALKTDSLFLALKKATPLEKTLFPKKMLSGLNFANKKEFGGKFDKLNSITKAFNPMMENASLIKEFPYLTSDTISFLRRIRVFDAKEGSRLLTLEEIKSLAKKKNLMVLLNRAHAQEIETIANREALQISGDTKGKIPRYIYHMTSEENWLKIILDDSIKPSKDTITGVFATDLDNLVTRWSSFMFQERKTNLLGELLEHINKQKDKIVCLRISTAGLDRSKLLIRSQNRLFGSDSPGTSFLRLTQDIPEEKLIERLSSGISSYSQKALMPEFTEHAIAGSPAGRANLFKQRKEAIEYIYTDSVPLSSVQVVGEVTPKEIKKSAYYDKKNPFKSILMELFKETPEQKAVSFLTC